MTENSTFYHFLGNPWATAELATKSSTGKSDRIGAANAATRRLLHGSIEPDASWTRPRSNLLPGGRRHPKSPLRGDTSCSLHEYGRYAVPNTRGERERGGSANVLIDVLPLLDHLKANSRHSGKTKLSRGGGCHIDYPPAHEGATVVDPHHDGAAGPMICHTHLCTER